MRKLISTQTFFTAVVAVLALAIFNLTRPALQSDLLVEFNGWYKGTSSLLAQTDPATLGNSKLSVTVSLTGRPTPPPTLSWTLPSGALTETTERENTARVLQLIHESGVFGLPTIKNPKADAPYLSISIRDGERSFETTVPAAEVEKSIQIQNLLKLLDIFEKSGPGVAIQPSRT
jgi:hypothetical protein